MQLRHKIEAMSEKLTPAERKVVSALLSDYPFAGLGTIQSLSEKTNVSAPSITRFVHKLGFQGYQEFQRRLIGDLKKGQQSPIDLHRSQETPKGDFLRGFLYRAAEVVASASDGITEQQFERICSLLGDEKRALYILGGRFSDQIAQHLSKHLRPIRPHVYHLPPDPDAWPEYILRMRARDMFVIYDFRRYQSNLEQMAKTAVDKRAINVVAITDKWISPVARHAAEVLALPIENGTIWDSYAGAMALTEAIVARIGEQDWDKTKARFEAWDAVRMDRAESGARNSL